MSLDPASFEQLAATLAQTRPVLDEQMDGRVRARLVQALRDDARQGEGGHERDWRLRFFAFASAAAVVMAILWWARSERAHGDREGALAPAVADRAADRAAPAAYPAFSEEPPLDLQNVGDSSVELLRACLRDADPVVRMRAAAALAKVGDEHSIPALAASAEGDPDSEVRGNAAEALGKLRAYSTGPLLSRLEAAAPAPLKVWYASALARLGDMSAIRRLIRYASNGDLSVSFKATLALAEISSIGDRGALAALRRIASREAELNDVVPYAGAVILAKMAALGDPKARHLLRGVLKSSEESIRLAAAEVLARIGDDAGRDVLHDISSNPESPNRLMAAVAQIALGDHSGSRVIEEHLKAETPESRQLAVRGLGEIGDPTTLRVLLTMSREDTDWTVRIAAAVAIREMATEKRSLEQLTEEAASAARATLTPTRLKDLQEGEEILTDSAQRAFLAAAETELEIGNLTSAKAHLDTASKARGNAPQLHFLYGRFYEARAEKTGDAAGKRKLLQQALASYKRSSSPKAKAKAAELTTTLAAP
jgi:HEAT repeat protein